MSDSDSDAPPEVQGFDDDEEVGEWWEQEGIEYVKKGERRWETLKHNGVLFPPPYKPHGIPVLYEGKPFHMTPEEEELATMFAAFRENPYYQQERFRSNFFESWQKVLKKRGTHPIRRLEYCDFDAIYEHIQREKEARLNMTKEEKKALAEAKKKQEAPYLYCLWNGKKEKLANFRVEPPGLFRGRGDHPLRGYLKARITPEDVTINITEGETPPPPPAGHKWKAVVHDHNVTWLAYWTDTLTGNNKYVMLAAASSVKGVADRAKFDRARELEKHIDKIRDAYRQWFHSSDYGLRQKAVAIYFIDRLALRVGNEKKEDEAETVGCCSLKCEHVECIDGNRLHFNFLGKDSIRYDNIVEVDPEVHKLVQQFKDRQGSPHADLFSLVVPQTLNTEFKKYMPDLTAKVFRTYNASKTLQQYFKQHPYDVNWTPDEKLAYFTKANTEVAILCNHQKTVSKQQLKTLAAMSGRITSMKTTLARLQQAQAAGGTIQAMEKFFAAQDAEQYEWLEKWGTPEDKAKYDEIVANRVIVADNGKAPATKPKTKSEPRVKREKKERTVADLDDDDDLPIALLTPAKGSKRAKKEKEEDVKEEEADDEDEDVPVTALPSKKGRSSPAAKTSAKKSDKKKAKAEKKAAKKATKKVDKSKAKKADKKAKPAAKKSPAKSKKDDKKKKGKAAASGKKKK